MTRDSAHFLLLNIGHFLDHLFMLIFATAAALVLVREWDMTYAELVIYATPGFVAFGVCSLPAGWIADRWSRDGMMGVFFAGTGAASILTGFAQTPLQIGLGLFAIGVFASIYHPVGLAIVTLKWRNIGMRIATNGVWGNLGVAAAALITGFLIDHGGWRMAFILPGLFSLAVGLAYVVVTRGEIAGQTRRSANSPDQSDNRSSGPHRALLVRISAIVFVTTAVSSVIFQSTTFALPKIFDERLRGLADQLSQLTSSEGGGIATWVGTLAFLIFTVASMAQLIVGALLDRFGPRTVFLVLAAMQLVFFAMMPGLEDGLALAVALGFMLGAFGQIPINDYMIGKIASGEQRARIYGVRYVVAFSVLAATLPLVAFVHQQWGFDILFLILSGCAGIVFLAVAALPGKQFVAASRS